MKRSYIIVFLFVILVLSGCARTVTERVPFGSRMVANVNFSSRINFSENKYYMVISSNSDYQLPFPPDYEFIEPGIPPLDPQIDYFQFYSTWSGYVVVDGGIIYLVDGPFASSTETYSRVQVGGPVELENNLSFQFRLEQIFGSELPDVVYFDFVSVDSWNALMDHLASSSNAIIRYDGMIVSGSDEGDAEIDPSLDILDWSVLIQ